MPELEKLPLPEIRNVQLVGIRGDRIVVAAPRMHMTADEALVHAAWLITLAECALISARVEGADGERFLAILQAVRNT